MLVATEDRETCALGAKAAAEAARTDAIASFMTDWILLENY